MKVDFKRVILYLIVIVPFIIVVSISFFIHDFYLNKTRNYFSDYKSNSLQYYMKSQREEGELELKQLSLLFEHKNRQILPDIKKDLEKKVDLAYKIAQNIYKKYKGKKSSKDIKQRIKDVLNEIVYKDESQYIFMSDYNANTILKGSHLADKKIALYLDADYRSIVYEEIQKVRKYGKGFITSRRGDNQQKEIIFVKDLGFYGWYIGASTQIVEEEKKLKESLLIFMQSIPLKSSLSLAIYEENTKLFSSQNFMSSKKDYHYIARYYKPFDWYLIYGFDTTSINKKIKRESEQLEKLVEKESNFALKISEIIIFITLFFSLLFSLSIHKIFKNYEKELEEKSLEKEVLENEKKENF